ncbi:MAG: DUF456 domain-containing protein [Anaerolineales bacterium]|nr:DUF456 domain-containing protein [Anaerolineales bacterium]
MESAWLASLVTVVAGLLMLIGVLGVVIPVLPDIVLIWLAALGYGLIVGWGTWGGWIFAGITLMAVIAIASDFWASGVGAKVGGASMRSILIGIVLGLIGLIFTPIGAVVGFLAGVFISEYVRLQDAEKALRGVLGVSIGYGASFGVKLGLSLFMIAAWLVWVFQG